MKIPMHDRQWFLDRVGKKIYNKPVSLTCTCPICQNWRKQGYIEMTLEWCEPSTYVRKEWIVDYCFGEQYEHGGFWDSLEEYKKDNPPEVIRQWHIDNEIDQMKMCGWEKARMDRRIAIMKNVFIGEVTCPCP